MFVAFLIIATLLSYMLLIRIDMIKNLINTEEDIGCAIMCIMPNNRWGICWLHSAIWIDK